MKNWEGVRGARGVRAIKDVRVETVTRALCIGRTVTQRAKRGEQQARKDGQSQMGNLSFCSLIFIKKFNMVAGLERCLNFSEDAKMYARVVCEVTSSKQKVEADN